MRVNDSPSRPIMIDTPKDSPSNTGLRLPAYTPPTSGSASPEQRLRIANPPTGADRMKSRFAVFAKKLLVFMISHVGLTCLVVSYAIAGGFIFMKLEAAQAVESRVFIGEIRRRYVRQLWEVTQDLNVLHEDNWTARADELLKDFQLQVFETVKSTASTGWDGSDSVTEGSVEWTYAGSLLYSVTVITTIGYGHLTPRTTWGRLVTIIYALVGIPLTLMCLANIGSFMAKCFRLFWKNVLCRVCLARKKTQLGHKFPIQRKSQNGLEASTHPGTDSALPPEDKQAFSDVVECPGDVKDPVVVRIPIYVCLFLLTGYICLGAMLFTFWEDWTYFEGIYFCFITLSTIGFGDYVPGHSHGSWQDQAKRVSCTFYLLYGLALISMCFDLMQFEVKIILNDIGRAMGLRKTDAEDV